MHKMNEIVNKFLLGGDKFMPEIHLTLFRMGFFGAAHGWGGGGRGGQKGPPSLKSVTHILQ